MIHVLLQATQTVPVVDYSCMRDDTLIIIVIVAFIAGLGFGKWLYDRKET